jgi:hypothetical protein
VATTLKGVDSAPALLVAWGRWPRTLTR